MARKTNEYSAENLQVLEGLEAVRKRPGMYIGSTDSRGLQHCAWEIIDNAVDEAIAGYCDTIIVTLHADRSVSVADNGRGIPVDTHSKTGLSGVELVYTKLHAGGKFGGGGYEVSGGLHGVGASVVNALSSRLDIEVDRDGATYAMSFHRGEPGVFDDEGNFARRSGMTKRPGRTAGTGTRVRYWADREIFLADADIDLSLTYDRARQTAFLVPGLTITVVDDRAGDAVTESFRYDGGTADFVEFLAPDPAIAPPIIIKGEGRFTETVPMLHDGQLVSTNVERTLTVDVAVRWGTGYDTTLRSFVNIIATPKGGTHVVGFERALTRSLVEAAANAKALRANEENPTKDDVLEGLTAVVCVRLAEPQFEGQTKEILGTAAATKVVADVVGEALREHFAAKANKASGRKIIDKVVAAARVRRELRLKKETARRKTALETSTLPAKLADCRSDDLERCEVFIVEGDSAAGCFSADTSVALADGTSLTFAELVADAAEGIIHDGLATDVDGEILVVPLRDPRCTRTAAAVLSVMFDDSTAVRCTPDHLFRRPNGSYVSAQHLAPGSEIMAASLTGTPTIFADDPLRVREVATRPELIDVYDLTVDVHHNFALANGAFVHNSAKGARDSEYQAVLPIRGKILNTFRATEKQMIDNNEIASIITAIGGGSGKSFDVSSIRYGRVIIMSVTGSTPVLLVEDGRLRLVPIGPAVDEWLAAGRDVPGVDTASLDPVARTSRVAPIARAIRHRYTGVVRTVETAAGRRVSVTAGHSVFTYVDGAITLRPASELRVGHLVVAPRRLPRPDAYLRELHLPATSTEEEQLLPLTETLCTLLGWYGSMASMGDMRDIEQTLAIIPEMRLVARPDIAPRDAARLFQRVVAVVFPGPSRDASATLLNLSPDHQLAFLRGYARAVGYSNTEGVTLPAPDTPTADSLAAVLAQFGVLASCEDGDLRISRPEDLRTLAPAWPSLDVSLVTAHAQSLPEPGPGLVALPITAIVDEDVDEDVYDFSVERDESFVAGHGGGVMAHNTDADVDGAHIRCLILTLCYRYMRPLLEEGHVYAAVPPLHRVTVSGTGENIYTYTDEEYLQLLTSLEAAGKRVKETQRYKGLGEMDADQLAETTIDPAHRVLRRITIDDAAAADQLFEVLMGKDVEPRREYIVDNALTVSRDRIDA